MALTMNTFRINAMMQSKSMDERQQGQYEALGLSSRTRHLQRRIDNCSPVSLCNMSACEHCGNSFPRNKDQREVEQEFRYYTKPKRGQHYYDEHPTIETVEEVKRHKSAPRAAEQDFIAFESQHWSDNILAFTLNHTIIPFDHHDANHALGHYKDDPNCLAAEVRCAITAAKAEIRKLFFKYLDDAPFIGLFENAIVELQDHPLWISNKAKWNKPRSECKYGVLVHFHGVFAGATKDAFKKACAYTHHDGVRQTCVRKLTPIEQKDGYQKGGIGGVGRYTAKNGILKEYGPDGHLIIPIHEHLRKQVGRSLIKLNHKSYKPYPLVRTWECLDPKDFDIYDEMKQDYLEHYVYQFECNLYHQSQYDSEPNYPDYDDIFSDDFLDEHFESYPSYELNNPYFDLSDDDINDNYLDYIKYENDHGSSVLNNHDSFNTVSYIKSLSSKFRLLRITLFYNYGPNIGGHRPPIGNWWIAKLLQNKRFNAKKCRDKLFRGWQKVIKSKIPLFHKRE